MSDDLCNLDIGLNKKIEALLLRFLMSFRTLFRFSLRAQGAKIEGEWWKIKSLQAQQIIFIKRFDIFPSKLRRCQFDVNGS